MEYSKLRARARENLRGHWGVSVAAAFVAAIFAASVAASSASFNLNIDAEVLGRLPETVAAFFTAVMAFFASTGSALNFVQLILGGVIQLGYCKFLLKQHDGQEYAVKDLFSQFDRFGVGFLQRLLRNLYTFLWGLLLLIPGIVKSYSYAMTPFILADHPEMTAKQAIEASKAMMDGYKGDLFVLELTFLGWDLLCILTLGIGSLWLTPYKAAAEAAFYRELLAQRRETSVE